MTKAFYNRGYNAFVVTYTINLMLTDPLKLQPLQDLARAVKLVKKMQRNFTLNVRRIFYID